MTKEERDKREEEKKARMEGSPDIGGVSLPFSRTTLLKAFWGFILIFPAWTLWNAKESVTFEGVFAGSVLFVACMLPSWFWATGRIQGLPIFPVFGLTFLPTYVTPLWQGHSVLEKYTANEINTAAWTVAGFLIVAQLFWQQVAVRAIGIPHAVRMIDLKKAEKVLLACLIAEVVFELMALFVWQLGGGAFAAVRGFATAAGRMAIFVFCYQMGTGELAHGKKILVLCILSLLIVQETASLILATVLPTLGLAFAGYILGAGKIPWKALGAAVVVVSILHAGKYEMREKYLGATNYVDKRLGDYPMYFAEWVGYGLKNLGLGKKTEEKKEDISSAKERAALLPLMILIQTTTPDKVPYLEGESYRFIPELLIPRVLSPEKKWAHTGNMMLSLRYGLLDEEGIWRTSIAFDPIMEAYANYGFIGVGVLAVVMGFFLGTVTKFTIHVPMLSFGFLFGVQIVAASISAFNTAGVFVTTTWQAFLALCGLSLVLMTKMNNPVWKYYAAKLAEKLRLKGPDLKLQKTLQEVQAFVVPGEAKTAGDGSEAQADEEKDEPNHSSQTSDEIVRHARPTRFVYGEKKK